MGYWVVVRFFLNIHHNVEGMIQFNSYFSDGVETTNQIIIEVALHEIGYQWSSDQFNVNSQ